MRWESERSAKQVTATLVSKDVAQFRSLGEINTCFLLHLQRLAPELLKEDWDIAGSSSIFSSLKETECVALVSR